MEVGDRWTYSIVKVQTTDAIGILDTLSTEILTLRVIERLPLADQTYFALSDGSLYRLDEASRTWRYDTEAESEKIVWDIWGPIAWQVWAGPSYIPWIERPVVVDGYACEYDGCLSRYGPFVRHVVPAPQRSEFEEVDLWITTINTDDDPYYFRIGNFLYFPYVWTYVDRLKLPAWNVTELYVFEDTPATTGNYPTMTMVVAPNVGVVYYAFDEYIYDDSTSAGKVSRLYDHDPSGGPTRIETTAWVLQEVQKGDLGNTGIEDTSWGQLKQRMGRPSSGILGASNQGRE